MSSVNGEKSKRAMIIGAGPGGLTAAIALSQAGFEPVIYEQANEMREIGSGLTLWPNAMCALEQLGLAEAVQAVSLPFSGIAMRSWRGELLFDVVHQPEENFGVYGVAIHRAELLNVLLGALNRTAITFGTRCISYHQDDQQVSAIFDRGLEVSGDILIGADGIKSVIRAQLFKATPLQYAGYTVWRGVTQFKLGNLIGLTSLGRGAQFGLFPMTQDRVYWFACANALAGDLDWDVGRKQELLERFRDWHEPIAAVIAATDESAILRNDIYDLDPLEQWSDKRVVLLGDAAHPATPNLGQGVCQAIEDAVVLKNCLQAVPEIALALKAYESRRIPRTSEIVMQSRRMGQMGQWNNPILCWLRNQLIKRTPELVRFQQLSKIFSF
ncbi:monooxygenase FAD-binding protein [Microchaete diplosiphon NIES-3275]|nr:monooxygenase FAD-binding protein [Microchaete diplosiphon NIES-3275]